MIEAVRGTAAGGAPGCPAICPRCWQPARAGDPGRPRGGRPAAAVGTDFRLDLLTEASDLDADACGGVDELWRRRILRVFRDGYDFSHDLLRERLTRNSARRSGGCCTGGSPRASSCCTPRTRTAVSAQLAQQYARGGRPGRAVAYYRRAANVAAGMFAHAEAIRLDQETLSIVRGLPAGRTGTARNWRSWRRMAAPLNARYGYSSRELQQTLRALGRPGRIAGPHGLEGQRPGRAVRDRFVQGRTAEGTGGRPRAGPGRARLRAERPGSFRRGRVGHQPRQARGGPASPGLAAKLASGAVSLSIGTRPDVHGTAWAAHAHWLLGDDDGPCRPATTRSAGPADRSPVQPGRGPGVRRHHLPDAPRLPGLRRPSKSCVSCASGTASRTTASGR